jgi:hypothetical protein
LNRFKDGRFSVFTKREGLPDDSVNSIVEDDSTNLWIGCERGIYQISIEALNDVIAGRAKALEPVLYTEGDGVNGNDTNGSKNQPAACKTRDGQLWFATPRGLTRINPRHLPQRTNPPPVVIEQVFADREIVFDNANPVSRRLSVASRQLESPPRTTNHGRPTNPKPETGNSKLLLPPGSTRTMEFHFTANSLTVPEKNRFKYRMDGVDQDWVDGGTRRVANYNLHRPGDYQFRVIGCNNQNVWNTTGATFAFSIAPFFYQTWSFRGVCLLFVGALVGFVFWREKKIARLRHALALENQRSRIARDLHEQLGAKLTHLAILGSTGDSPVPPGDPPDGTERKPQKNPKDPEDVTSASNAESSKFNSRPPSQINQLAQQTIGDLTDLVWSVDPRCDTLEAFITYLVQFAEEEFAEGKTRCRFELPDKIPPVPVPAELRHKLFLAAKDLLQRIAGQQCEAAIRVALEESAFEISIETRAQFGANWPTPRNKCNPSARPSSSAPVPTAHSASASARHWGKQGSESEKTELTESNRI